MRIMDGIAFAGNLIIDFIKYIDTYPEISRLATIKRMSKSVGGLVCNTGIAFSRLSEKKIPVKAYGRIGDDESGEYIKNVLKSEGVDVSNIKTTKGAATSFTDVFTVESSGERTFFQNRGANALFSPDDIESINTRILHIGYVLLLDSFDEKVSENETVMSQFLEKVQNRGIKTSIDVVSEQSERFALIVRPTLKHLNYLILNETESGLVAGIPPRLPDGRLNENNIEKICKYFKEAGVKDLAVVHSPEGSYCMGEDGRLLFTPAANLPGGSIKGKVGAGDAFTAGVLYALYNGADSEEAMRLGNGAAALSLLGGSVMDGMASAKEALAVYRKYNG
jgi:sugar/nucleoside kinase (ribokinase family)